MQDMTISGRTVAIALWIVGAGLIVGSIFGPLQLAHFGLFAAGAGGVTQIRGYICALSQRERDAFDLGRESVRSLR